MVKAQPTLEDLRDHLERALLIAESMRETYLCAVIDTALQAVLGRLRSDDAPS